MKITTRAVYDKDWNLIEEESYEYGGPVAMLGGGPSESQKQAAAAQAQNSAAELAAAQQEQQRQTDAYNSVKPFATKLMTEGDPSFGSQADYAGGNAAKSFAPARAALTRQLSSIGSLPSGFKTGAMADLNEKEAQMQDGNLAQVQQNQLQTKLQGANIINGFQSTYNPAQMYGTSNGANTSILNAPLTSPGAAGILGGLAGAGFTAGKTAISF